MEEFVSGWKPRAVQAVKGGWLGIPYMVANWGNELMNLFDDGHSYHTTHEKTVKRFEALRDEGYTVYLSSDFSKFETA